MGGNGDYPINGNPNEEGNIDINNPAQEDTGHEKGAVMKTLKRHALLSLVDITAVVMTFFVCYPVGKAFGYVHVTVLCYWIPLWVVKSSFKHMSGLCPPVCLYI